MGLEEAVQSFESFNEIARRVAESPLAGGISSSQIAALVSAGLCEKNTPDDVKSAPLGESMLALKSLYVSGGEDIAISQLSKLYHDIPVDRSVSQAFWDKENGLNQHLSGFTRLTGTEKDTLSRKDVLEIFFAQTRSAPEDITSDPKAHDIFSRIIRNLVQVVESLIPTNEKAIHQMSLRMRIKD